MGVKLPLVDATRILFCVYSYIHSYLLRSYVQQDTQARASKTMKMHNAFTTHIVPLHCLIGQIAIRMLRTPVTMTLTFPQLYLGTASCAWEVQCNSGSKVRTITNSYHQFVYTGFFCWQQVRQLLVRCWKQRHSDSFIGVCKSVVLGESITFSPGLAMKQLGDKGLQGEWIFLQGH